MMARTPLVLFIFYLYYLSGDPMFLIRAGWRQSWAKPRRIELAC